MDASKIVFQNIFCNFDFVISQYGITLRSRPYIRVYKIALFYNNIKVAYEKSYQLNYAFEQSTIYLGGHSSKHERIGNKNIAPFFVCEFFNDVNELKHVMFRFDELVAVILNYTDELFFVFREDKEIALVTQVTLSPSEYPFISKVKAVGRIMYGESFENNINRWLKDEWQVDGSDENQ
jgi:hypothetical protein